MRRSEFEDSIGLLKQVYGDHKYPSARTEILWEKFKYLRADTFHEAIESLVASEPYAPLLPKFQDILREELRKAREQKAQNVSENSPDCTRCKNVGSVAFFKIGEPEYYGPYSFQCKCPKGPILARGMPKQYSGMEEEYYLHWAHRVGPVPGQSEKAFKSTQTTSEFKTPGQEFEEMDLF